MIHGHADIISSLEQGLPPVSLFTGPPSIGKWAVAEHFRAKAGVLPADVLRVHQLTADKARTIVRFTQTAPTGSRKMVLVRLDGASPAIQNILLKTLEEPGEVTFFLVAEKPVLPAVASRAVRFRFGLLTDEQVASVLVERNKMSNAQAQKLAVIGAGRIRPAMKSLELAPDRNRTITVVKGLRERDLEQVLSMAGEWTDEATELLSEWCYEALTGRPRVFTEDEINLTKIGKHIPVGILQGLADDPRPRWVVRTVVAPLLRGA